MQNIFSTIILSFSFFFAKYIYFRLFYFFLFLIFLFHDPGLVGRAHPDGEGCHGVIRGASLGHEAELMPLWNQQIVVLVQDIVLAVPGDLGRSPQLPQEGLSTLGQDRLVHAAAQDRDVGLVDAAREEVDSGRRGADLGHVLVQPIPEAEGSLDSALGVRDPGGVVRDLGGVGDACKEVKTVALESERSGFDAP